MIEGEALRALPEERATRAPIIAQSILAEGGLVKYIKKYGELRVG